MLTSEAEQDEAFATDLAQLVRELTEEPKLTSFITHIYGQAKVGQVLNIQQAGNLSSAMSDSTARESDERPRQ